MQIQNATLIVILISLISACASKDDIIPVPKQSMLSVYNSHMNGTNNGALYETRSILRRPLTENDMVLSDYVRTETNQLRSKFKMLPNPILYMFVAPHLSELNKVPVPGYLTEFRMWSSDNYALPSEISLQE